MKIKILYKEKQRNVPNRDNHITFTIDNVEFTIPIIYIESLRRNAFLEDASMRELEEYIKRNYVCTWQEFGDYFFNHVVYKYSRGIGLVQKEYKDLSNLKRKDMK